jgi:hypothetical protein
MHSKFTPKIWSAPKVHSKSFGVHFKSTPKFLECTSIPLQKIWSALKVHSKKFGVHSKSTPKNLECTQSPLQKYWSTQHSTPRMSTFWSAQLPTLIFLEWTAVHSNFVGVDRCSLHLFWSGQMFTPFFLVWTLSHSKILECM